MFVIELSMFTRQSTPTILLFQLSSTNKMLGLGTWSYITIHCHWTSIFDPMGSRNAPDRFTFIIPEINTDI